MELPPPTRTPRKTSSAKTPAKTATPLKNISNAPGDDNARTPVATKGGEEASDMDQSVLELDNEIRSILSPTFSTASDLCRTPAAEPLAADDAVPGDELAVMQAMRDSSEPESAFENDSEAAESEAGDLFPEEEEEEEEEQAGGRGESDDCGIDSLVSGLLGMAILPQPLKGVPTSSGEHVRFEEGDGDGLVAVPSPSNGRTKLAGVPRSTGQHVRFD